MFGFVLWFVLVFYCVCGNCLGLFALFGFGFGASVGCFVCLICFVADECLRIYLVDLVVCIYLRGLFGCLYLRLLLVLGVGFECCFVFI